jgi:hypothetical protein
MDEAPGTPAGDRELNRAAIGLVTAYREIGVATKAAGGTPPEGAQELLDAAHAGYDVEHLLAGVAGLCTVLAQMVADNAPGATVESVVPRRPRVTARRRSVRSAMMVPEHDSAAPVISPSPVTHCRRRSRPAVISPSPPSRYRHPFPYPICARKRAPIPCREHRR